ncbi:ArsR/SmtB family transcription factor [Alicyclobacillus sp. ALC3]|uniref:ArsR/SmtB family transcription factor n=1 Tax=Alicyclobacillus sp. ALC3 TaxID=2796143 RepID=UPI0023799296|nr:metalloregulator ArsR/SmtB family transcription factor [Alicyclobacillus sp. ALC3]WDL98894.1 ArsR family transcriptional regulator [Alicyclobacillus sp. ALC3]
MDNQTRAWKDAIYEHFGRIGKALSSPRRLEILDLLSQGSKTVETLAKEAGMSIANVSQHLQTLLQARLVQFEKQGTYAVYRLSNEKISTLLLLIQELGEELLAEIRVLRDEFLVNRDLFEPITLDELKTRMDMDEVYLIDVRPKEEFEYGHIPGAFSIPVKELADHLSSIDTNRPVVAYCRGRYCMYAVEAVEMLREHGFHAIRMDEGVREWKQEPLH